MNYKVKINKKIVSAVELQRLCSCWRRENPWDLHTRKNRKISFASRNFGRCMTPTFFASVGADLKFKWVNWFTWHLEDTHTIEISPKWCFARAATLLDSFERLLIEDSPRKSVEMPALVSNTIAWIKNSSIEPATHEDRLRVALKRLIIIWIWVSCFINISKCEDVFNSF